MTIKFNQSMDYLHTHTYRQWACTTIKETHPPENRPAYCTD